MPRLDLLGTAQNLRLNWCPSARAPQSWSGSPERMYGQQYQSPLYSNGGMSRAGSVTSLGSVMPVSLGTLVLGDCGWGCTVGACLCACATRCFCD